MTDPTTPPASSVPPEGAPVPREPRRARRDRRSAAPLPAILHASDLGELLGLQSTRAARTLIVREGIPHVRLGKRMLVLTTSLLRWIEARERVDDRAARVTAAADRLRGSRVCRPVSTGRSSSDTL